MCIENTHFKCLENYYRDLRVEVTHLFLECRQLNIKNLKKAIILCYRGMKEILHREKWMFRINI